MAMPLLLLICWLLVDLGSLYAGGTLTCWTCLLSRSVCCTHPINRPGILSQKPVVPSTIAWILNSRPQGLGCVCSWPLREPTTPPLPLGRCATGRSMSSSSPPSHQTPSVPLTCLICTCTEGPLRRCLPMKIRSILTIGQEDSMPSLYDCHRLPTPSA